jgi:hypothetical protein
MQVRCIEAAPHVHSLEGAHRRMYYPDFTRRSVAALCFAALLDGCATKSPYPRFAQLQDPLPGQALLYLLRAPHDDAPLQVHLNTRPIVTLPGDSYTVVSLSPGTYLLTCTGRGMNGNDQLVAEPIEMQLNLDERRVLLMLGVVERKSERNLFLLGQTKVARGTRAWQTVGDSDASSLIPGLALVHANGN